MTDCLDQGLPVEKDLWTLDAAILKQVSLDKNAVQALIEPTRKLINRTLEMLKPGERV
ncbi:MAG: hypothetical protein J6386_14575 [Candidatus Synoicihabitans palmerolidicus]|nr:hypothetical protein [Candidatus Synoicihabitans palmerolidicus]